MSRASKNAVKTDFIYKLLVIFFAILFLLFLFGIVREYFHKRQLNNEISQLNQELGNLKLNQDKFLSSIENYQSDFFTEQEAREKFNMKKVGENVVVIPIENNQLVLNNNEVVTDSREDLKSTKSSNLSAWWEYFFGQRS
jgi:cell division protein FtsB